MRYILAVISMTLTVYALTITPEPGVSLAIPAFLAPLIGAAAGAAGEAIFGGGEVTHRTELDPATQRFLEDFIRPRSRHLSELLSGGIGIPDISFTPESFRDFMDPFQQEVIAATEADFDRLSARAGRSARQEAALAGSARGSRGAVLQAIREGEVERNRAATIAGLRSAGFEQANRFALGRAGFNVDRINAALQGANFGLGPTQGAVATQQPRNIAGAALSGGLLAAGAFGNQVPRAPGFVNVAPPTLPNDFTGGLQIDPILRNPGLPAPPPFRG